MEWSWPCVWSYVCVLNWKEEHDPQVSTAEWCTCVIVSQPLNRHPWPVTVALVYRVSEGSDRDTHPVCECVLVAFHHSGHGNNIWEEASSIYCHSMSNTDWTKQSTGWKPEKSHNEAFTSERNREKHTHHSCLSHQCVYTSESTTTCDS